MASANYIAAAKKENRKPTVLLSIEDADAETTYYTTQAQWAGSDTLTRLAYSTQVYDYLGTVGDVWHDMQGDSAGTSPISDLYCRISSAAYNGYIKTFRARVFWSTSFGSSITATLYAFDTSPFSLIDISIPQTITADGTSGAQYYSTDTYIFSTAFPVAVGDDLTFQVVGTGPQTTLMTYSGSGVSASSYTVQSTAQLVTSAIDLGGTPLSQPTINIDDTKESGAAIAYSYTYSSDDISYSSGGSITDGDSLTAARYYKIQADFSTTTGGRGLIRELSITEGLFRYYGTHPDEPFSGIKPYIVQDSVGTIKGEIKLDKGVATTGEMSIRLLYTPDVSDLVATGFLKGKDVQVLAGFVGLDTESYEPILTGSIQDVSTDPIRGEVTLSLRNILKQFEKRKLPTVTYDASGANTGTDLTYPTTSIITVIKDIFDEVGIRARYIHADYDTLEAGDYAANKYKVSRIIPKTKPEEAWKLLDELGQLGGIFMVPLGNGEIKPKVYNRNEVPSITISADELTYKKVEILYKEFLSRFYAYYNPDATDYSYSSGKVPSSADHFDNAKFLFNATAETLYFPEKGQKDFFDKWRVGRTTTTTALTSPPAALTDLVDRWDSWYSDPLFKFNATDMPPRFASIDPGDVIGINDLPLPVPASDNDWDSVTTYDKGERVTHEGRVYQAIQGSNTNKEPEANPDYWADIGIRYEQINHQRYGFSDGMRWLVLSKTFDPNRAEIDMTFLQMPYAELGAFSADEFSTAFSTTGN